MTAIQARLVSIVQQLPPQTDLAIWLHQSLVELREIMNLAYRAVVVTQAYGPPPQLAQLIVELHALEEQIIVRIGQQLLARGNGVHHELLSGRLATLWMCARELSRLSGGPNPLVVPP